MVNSERPAPTPPTDPPLTPPTDAELQEEVPETGGGSNSNLGQFMQRSAGKRSLMKASEARAAVSLVLHACDLEPPPSSYSASGANW